MWRFYFTDQKLKAVTTTHHPHSDNPVKSLAETEDNNAGQAVKIFPTLII
jgi:hypothetical protein